MLIKKTTLSCDSALYKNLNSFYRRLTTIMFDHLDRCSEKMLQDEQREREDDMFEEEESDEEEQGGWKKK